VVAVVACWTGPETDGPKALAPLGDWGQVIGAHVGRMPYPALNSLFDDLVPAGLQQYWKANFVRELTDDAIAAHVEHGARVPCIESGTFLFPIDGACHGVGSDATAFAYRDERFSVVIAGAWPEPRDNERNVAWVRRYHEALRPFSEEGGYVNFMSGDDADRVRANYGRNYARLTAVKRQYDPGNLFRMNQNVAP
jgi:FAD/FMN-containing dehydrogenase